MNRYPPALEELAGFPQADDPAVVTEADVDWPAEITAADIEAQEQFDAEMDEWNCCQGRDWNCVHYGMPDPRPFWRVG